MTNRLLPSLLALAAAALPLRAAEPVVDPPGPEEYISSLPMFHPSIAADSKGQPHLVCDQGGNTQFMKFHKVNGAWRGGVFAVGSRGGRYNASRLYIGQIEIDGKDRAWISCKFGAKEYGDPGQGIWLFNNVVADSTPPEQFFTFVSPHKGMGVVSLDNKYPDEGVDMATGGLYVKLNASGSVIGTGTINAGPGGEKLRFRIASYAPRYPAGSGGSYPDGIWHTAMNGYSSFASAYQNSARFKAGLGPVTWASYGAYPSQGSDYSHVGVGIDLSDPRVCYMGCVFDGRLGINIWNGSALLFSPSNLKILDYNANYEMRHTIQFAPAPAPQGGAFVFWSSGGRIKMCYLSKTGVMGAVRDIGAGVFPAACSDRFGNLHVAYDNSGIKYRKIVVQSTVAVSPVGRVTDTRCPVFRWNSNKNPANFTIELTHDGQVQPLIVALGSGGVTWQPSTNLAVGQYSWRIKTGGTDSPSPWSPRLEFVLPPAVPTPLLPTGRNAFHPTIPTFTWKNLDPETTRYTLRLFRDATAIGDLTPANEKGEDQSVDWTNALPAGRYAWQIRSQRVKPNHTVSSDWSEALTFQLGVPGTASITNPAASSAFPPATALIPCNWTPADGADRYDLRVLRNGKLLDVHTNLPLPAAELAGPFSPAHYTLLVRGAGVAGIGPWSEPISFLVERRMTPDGVVTNTTPNRFRWSRSTPATRYRLKLAQYDAGSGEYVDKREAWINQPASGLPGWTPPYIIPNGRFRWTITDYNGNARGFSQSAYFQIRNSGHASWNDPDLIVGSWKVLDVWRWKELVFMPDGVLKTIQGDGTAFTRARWSADGEILTLVSDVVEKCPYTVTATSLIFTTPSGNTHRLSRIR